MRDTLQRYIEVNFFGGLYVPNAIIPNDPNPDVRVFQPKGTGLGNYRAMVFDKWGNRLWESTELIEGSPLKRGMEPIKVKKCLKGHTSGKSMPFSLMEQFGKAWKTMIIHEVGTVTIIR